MICMKKIIFLFNGCLLHSSYIVGVELLFEATRCSDAITRFELIIQRCHLCINNKQFMLFKRQVLQ